MIMMMAMMMMMMMLIMFQYYLNRTSKKKMLNWYTCSKYPTTGCSAAASVEAWEEEGEDGIRVWHHKFVKVSSYEVKI